MAFGPLVGSARIQVRGDTSSFHSDVATGVGGAMGKWAGRGAVAAGVLAAAGIAKGLQEGISSTLNLRDAKLPLAQVASGAGLDIAKSVTDEMVSQFGLDADRAGQAVFTALSAGIKTEDLAVEMDRIGKAAIGLVVDADTAARVAALGLNAFGEDAESTFAKIQVASKDALGDAGTFAKFMPEAGAAAAVLGVDMGTVASMLTESSKQTQDLARSAVASKNFFNELANSESKVGKKFKEIFDGQSFKGFIDGGGDVLDALQKLGETAEAEGVSLSEFFGSVEAKAFADANLANLDAVRDRLVEVNDATFDGIERLYQNQRRSGAQLFAELKGKLIVAFSTLAEKILPKVLDAMDMLGTWIDAWIDGGGLDRLSEKLDTAGVFIMEHVVPALISMGNWIQEEGIPAFMLFVGFIRDDAIPTLQSMWGWFAQNILPTLIDLGDYFIDELVPRIQTFIAQVREHAQPTIDALSRFLNDHLVPAFNEVVAVIRDSVIPFLMDIVDAINEYVVPFVLEYLIPAFLDFVGALLDDVVPAAADLVSFIIDNIIPTIEFLGEKLGDFIIWLVDDAAPAVGDFGTALWGVFLGFGEFVGDVVNSVIGFIDDMLDKIEGAGQAIQDFASRFPGVGYILDQAGFTGGDPNAGLPARTPTGSILDNVPVGYRSDNVIDLRGQSAKRTYNITGVDAFDVVTQIEERENDLAATG